MEWNAEKAPGMHRRSAAGQWHWVEDFDLGIEQPVKVCRPVYLFSDPVKSERL